MLSTEGERIKELRQALKLKQSEFGALFSVGKSFISSIEKNKAKLSHNHLVYLLINYDVNINWLLAGIGNMFNDKDEIDKKVEQKIAEALSKYGLTEK